MDLAQRTDAKCQVLPVWAARVSGWETRLAAVIDGARSKPYALGQHDCFRMACAAVHALTLVDLWWQWEGTYSTRAQALRRIHRFAGAGFTAAACKLFATETKRAAAAMRGDIMEFADELGEQHLGVCVGADFALLAERGLIFLPLRAARHAWGIG